MKTEIEDRVHASVAEEMKRLEGFKPLWAFVLVQIERAELSTGGIVLPEQRKERPCIGKVIAVGPEVDPKAIWLGNRILFGRYAGVEVELPTGEKLTSHRILRDVECYGVFS